MQELNYVPWLQDPAQDTNFENLTVGQGLDEILPKEANPVHISPSDVSWLSRVLFPFRRCRFAWSWTRDIIFLKHVFINKKCKCWHRQTASQTGRQTHTHTHERAQACWNSNQTVGGKQRTLSFCETFAVCSVLKWLRVDESLRSKEKTVGMQMQQI